MDGINNSPEKLPIESGINTASPFARDPSKNNKITAAGIFVIVFSFMIFFGLYTFAKKDKSINIPKPGGSDSKSLEVKKFESEAEFKAFLVESKNLAGSAGYVSFGALEDSVSLPTIGGSMGLNAMEAPLMEKQTATVDRYSQTNVQVAGIDEPDILKTDGKNIFYSDSGGYFGTPMPFVLRQTVEDTQATVSEPSSGSGVSSSSKIIAPDSMPVYQNKVKVISAFPPGDLKKESEINGQGEMLLTNNILVVFNYNKISGYDVSNKKNPILKWSLDLDQESSSQIVTSRLKDGKIYLVTRNYVNDFTPCAIPVFAGDRLTIACTDIYHPGINVSVDSVITAMVVDPQSGKIDKKISFVGSSGQSIVYMSQDNLYVTYAISEDATAFMYNFLVTKASDLFPQSVLEKLKKLNSYDISNSSKSQELQMILSQYQASLGKDERLRVENELQNRLKDYAKEHSRDLEKTGIVKVGLDKFEVTGTGSVSGNPLNQFSLDEYQNNLRIATTTGGSWGSMASESFSDVYVLDKDLKKSGEVLDLGVGERIYSVRFIEGRGYVVTFKQTDPFYVLDLANENNPKKVGELKIPGFSSYLHPLKNNLILGVGQEDRQVKLSIFDVSSPSDPKEVEKYNLDEYWTEVQNNHHAFLNDSEKEVFFIPGGKGGYVFSYKNGLSLTKAVADYSVKRALYINNYFYIVGDNKISVFNQSDWTLVNSLDLN
ncbi:MAG: hypothetical protein UT10_C0010G0015 [Candidatus Woesebacteria bacterium GW2011_GWB1_38_8b]|uniref:Beta propeller domain protein n=1 Tax=Candidatus Woesebacteria bacterium GW2011_GWB1_38_8b TaxID=1618571 RepID=A0A0G0LGU9_9BACT|nr:MAG: hypothetical protein UT10_C0010G0015 [Candidatus Woesebacteria bacterium GW2011_GWB1_38_8b]